MHPISVAKLAGILPREMEALGLKNYLERTP
jgi:hypothetical protein